MSTIYEQVANSFAPLDLTPAQISKIANAIENGNGALNSTYNYVNSLSVETAGDKRDNTVAIAFADLLRVSLWRKRSGTCAVTHFPMS